MKTILIEVIFENGDSFRTRINTDLTGAKEYYLNKSFIMGPEEHDFNQKMHRR